MRIPFLQELIPMLADLSLQRAQLMLRHATGGGNAAIAQPKLRFLPTLPRPVRGAARANQHCRTGKSSPAISEPSARRDTDQLDISGAEIEDQNALGHGICGDWRGRGLRRADSGTISGPSIADETLA
jgi:hypothetical protein